MPKEWRASKPIKQAARALRRSLTPETVHEDAST